ncbi:MAG: tRNA threonylcarbamoyladenosine dehydratase [Armatimonadota bacterium]
MSKEQFQRLELLVGERGLARLQAARVAVIGLGAVGSYATEALARAGVGALRLVDFDVVAESNLNRQLYALHSTVGQPKAEVARARVHDINPDCEVEALRVFVHTDTMEEILAGPPDLVIDAIDSYNPKLELLSALTLRQIPAVSSMGAALRSDTTLIRLGRVNHTSICPLARQLRKGLRKRGLVCDIPCVYSEELVDANCIEELEEDEARVVDRGRHRRAMGSLPTMTGIFGLTVANVALKLLLAEEEGQCCVHAGPRQSQSVGVAHVATPTDCAGHKGRNPLEL